jgi:hypothetical protein
MEAAKINKGISLDFETIIKSTDWQARRVRLSKTFLTVKSGDFPIMTFWVIYLIF